MMGYCVLLDTDGDKIFGRFKGSGPLGGELTGRTEVSGDTIVGEEPDCFEVFVKENLVLSAYVATAPGVVIPR